MRGDIRLAGFNIDNPSGTLAFTYVPSGGSDMAIDTSESSLFTSGASQNYVYFRDTLMHEIGHSFGLEHVSTNEAATGKLLMEPFIDDSANPIDGPQLDEVRGVQYFFGDANEKSNNGLGNGTASRATSLGTLTSGSTRLVGASADVPTQADQRDRDRLREHQQRSDVDYYSFTVNSAASLSATLTPRGGVFSQGSADQNQTPTTFNANSRSNLALTILLDRRHDGAVASRIRMRRASPKRSPILLLPSAGKYYAKITGADDTIQMYELALTATSILARRLQPQWRRRCRRLHCVAQTPRPIHRSRHRRRRQRRRPHHTGRLRPVAVAFRADRKRQRLRACLWFGRRPRARNRDIWSDCRRRDNSRPLPALSPFSVAKSPPAATISFAVLGAGWVCSQA